MKFVCIFCTFLKAVFAHICANTARCLKLINSGGGVINGWLTRSVFRSLRLDVTLCRDSIHCPFESGLSPLTVVLLEAGIKVWCNPWITWPPNPSFFALSRVLPLYHCPIALTGWGTIGLFGMGLGAM